MPEQDSPNSGSFDEETTPNRLVSETDSTETIDLHNLFTSDVTSSGSFDVREGIWGTTFGRLVQALPIPALLIDRSFDIMVANQACGKISPQHKGIQGRPFGDLFAVPSEAERVLSVVEEVLSTRQPKTTESLLEIAESRTWGRMTFRSIRIIEERSILLLIEDLTLEKKHQQLSKRYQKELEKRVEERTAELTASNKRLHQEIAERKKAEGLLLQTERLKAVGELAGGVAHNFNNLLQIVVSGARLALMNLESGNHREIKRKLDQILESCEFGAETVRRVQSFAGIRTDDDSSEDSVFDIGDVARQAAELTKTWWKTTPQKQGIAINLRPRLNDGCVLAGKKHEMFEVVVNLIKNAVEALPEGGEILVATYIQENRVVLRVRDTGVGIPQKDLGQLFVPFFTTKMSVGTGLGLSTSQAIVKRHGGEIVVDSIEGEGSTFTVVLPKARELVRESRPAFKTTDQNALRILAIDDSEPLVDLLADTLREFNHTVLAALSGQEGIRTFKDNPVDVVICDLGMPGMTGWDVAEQLREICRQRGVPKTPFVVLTGWGDQVGETEKMKKSGVDRILTKPVDVPELMEALHELVQQPEAD